MQLPKWPGKSRAAIYLLLIFLCGMVGGAVATNLWTRWERDRDSRVAQAAPPLSRTQRNVARFTRDLHLTPEQAQQLTVILDETHQQYRSQEDATREQARNRVREILSDEQKPQYEEIVRRNDKRRRQNRQ